MISPLRLLRRAMPDPGPDVPTSSVPRPGGGQEPQRTWHCGAYGCMPDQDGWCCVCGRELGDA